MTVVPSASAFLTLRSLPAGSPGRENLIGLGHPYFSAEEAAEAEVEATKTADAVASDASADADWVVLSACNTGAGAGADRRSGICRR